MMPGIDLVIFDCDGVVVDSEMLACRALADALTGHGVGIGIDEVFDRFLGRSFALVEAHYREHTGRPLPETFRADLQHSLEQAFRASLRPIEGIREVIAAIGRACCVASSSDPRPPDWRRFSATGSTAPARWPTASRRRTCFCLLPERWALRRAAVSWWRTRYPA